MSKGLYVIIAKTSENAKNSLLIWSFFYIIIFTILFYLFFMKKYLSFVFLFCIFSLSLILSWCSWWAEDIEDKTPFSVMVSDLSGSKNTITIQKAWSLMWEQEITISAQAMWRVSSLIANPGDTVLSGQPVVQLRDDLANYDSQLQRAQSALDRARIQKDTTLLSLDNAVDNTLGSLVQAEESLRIAMQTLEQTRRQQNLSFAQTTTNTSLQFSSFQSSYESQLDSFLGLLQNILNWSDSLLGVTPAYQNTNYEFDNLVWARNSQQRSQTENQLRLLYKSYEELQKTESLENYEELQSAIDLLNASVQATSSFLSSMNQVLINSVSAVNFPQATIDANITITNSYQWSLQWIRTSLLNYKAQTDTALTELLEWEIRWIDFATENAWITREQAITNAENAVTNSQLAAAWAQRAHNQAVENRSSQEFLLENAIQDAQIQYQDAMRQYAKLTVTAPIRWTIWDILVDVWQELSIGTPVFTLSSIDNQLVEISFTAKEYPYVVVWEQVQVVYNDQQLTWTIQSLSSVATIAWSYKSVVSLSEPVSLLGGVARVRLSLDSPYTVLPLNAVTSLDNGEWYIWVINEDWLEKYTVSLWSVWWEYIEIIDEVPLNLQIVTSDVSNFDEREHTIVISN